MLLERVSLKWFSTQFDAHHGWTRKVTQYHRNFGNTFFAVPSAVPTVPKGWSYTGCNQLIGQYICHPSEINFCYIFCTKAWRDTGRRPTPKQQKKFCILSFGQKGPPKWLQRNRGRMIGCRFRKRAKFKLDVHWSKLLVRRKSSNQQVLKFWAIWSNLLTANSSTVRSVSEVFSQVGGHALML